MIKMMKKIAIVMVLVINFIHSKVFATPERTDNLRT